MCKRLKSSDSNYKNRVQQPHSYGLRTPPRHLQHAMELGSEKGTSSWLSILPIEEHGLHKGAFRDALCLWYITGSRPTYPTIVYVVIPSLLIMLSAAPLEASRPSDIMSWGISQQKSWLRSAMTCAWSQHWTRKHALHEDRQVFAWVHQITCIERRQAFPLNPPQVSIS